MSDETHVLVEILLDRMAFPLEVEGAPSTKSLEAVFKEILLSDEFLELNADLVIDLYKPKGLKP